MLQSLLTSAVAMWGGATHKKQPQQLLSYITQSPSPLAIEAEARGMVKSFLQSILKPSCLEVETKC